MVDSAVTISIGTELDLSGLQRDLAALKDYDFNVNLRIDTDKFFNQLEKLEKSLDCIKVALCIDDTKLQDVLSKVYKLQVELDVTNAEIKGGKINLDTDQLDLQIDRLDKSINTGFSDLLDFLKESQRTAGAKESVQQATKPITDVVTGIFEGLGRDIKKGVTKGVESRTGFNVEKELGKQIGGNKAQKETQPSDDLGIDWTDIKDIAQSASKILKEVQGLRDFSNLPNAVATIAEETSKLINKTKKSDAAPPSPPAAPPSPPTAPPTAPPPSTGGALTKQAPTKPSTKSKQEKGGALAKMGELQDLIAIQIEAYIVDQINEALSIVPGKKDVIDVSKRISSLSELTPSLMGELAKKGVLQSAIGTTSAVRGTYGALKGAENAVLSLDPTGVAKLVKNIVTPLLLTAAASQVPGAGLAVGGAVNVAQSALAPLGDVAATQIISALSGAISDVVGGLPLIGGQLEAGLISTITTAVTEAVAAGSGFAAAGIVGKGLEVGTGAIAGKLAPSSRALSEKTMLMSENLTTKLIADLNGLRDEIKALKLPATLSILPSALPKFSPKALPNVLEQNLNAKGLRDVYQQLKGTSGEGLNRPALTAAIVDTFKENQYEVRTALAKVPKEGLKKGAKIETFVKPSFEGKRYEEYVSEIKKVRQVSAEFSKLFDQSNDKVRARTKQGLEELLKVLIRQLNSIETVKKEYLLKGKSAQQLGGYESQLKEQKKQLMSRYESIGGNPNIEKAWQQTASHVEKKIVHLRKVAEDEGYKIQKGLAEGSPGITVEIRKHWAKTADFLEGKIEDLAKSSERKGQALLSAMTADDPDFANKLYTDYLALQKQLSRMIAEYEKLKGVLQEIESIERSPQGSQQTRLSAVKQRIDEAKIRSNPAYVKAPKVPQQITNQVEVQQLVEQSRKNLAKGINPLLKQVATVQQTVFSGTATEVREQWAKASSYVERRLNVLSKMAAQKAKLITEGLGAESPESLERLYDEYEILQRQISRASVEQSKLNALIKELDSLEVSPQPDQAKRLANLEKRIKTAQEKTKAVYTKEVESQAFQRTKKGTRPQTVIEETAQNLAQGFDSVIKKIDDRAGGRDINRSYEEKRARVAASTQLSENAKARTIAAMNRNEQKKVQKRLALTSNISTLAGSTAFSLAPLETLKALATPFTLAFAPLIAGFNAASTTIVNFVSRINSVLQELAPLQVRYSSVAQQQNKKLEQEINEREDLIRNLKETGGAETEIARQQRLVSSLKEQRQTPESIMNVPKQLAQDYSIPIMPTMQAYSKFVAAATGTALEGGGVAELFKGISQSVAALGLSAQDAELVFLAFQQMMSKGKISAEELRQQLAERMPGAVQLFAEAVGMTQSELNKAMETGSLDYADTLIKVAETMQSRYGEAAKAAGDSIVGATNRIQNSMTEAQLAVADVIAPAFSFGINALSKGLDFFAERAESIFNFVANLFFDLVMTMTASWAALWDDIGGFAMKAIAPLMAAMYKYMAPFAINIGVDFIDNFYRALTGKDVLSPLQIIMKGVENTVWTAFTAIKSLGSGINSVFQSVSEVLVSTFGSMFSVIGNLTNTITGLGVPLVELATTFVFVNQTMAFFEVNAQFLDKASRKLNKFFAEVATGAGRMRLLKGAMNGITLGLSSLELKLAGALSLILVMFAKSDFKDPLKVELDKTLKTLQAVTQQAKEYQKTSEEIAKSAIASKGFNVTFGISEALGGQKIMTDDVIRALRGDLGKEMSKAAWTFIAALTAGLGVALVPFKAMLTAIATGAGVSFSKGAIAGIVLLVGTIATVLANALTGGKLQEALTSAAKRFGLIAISEMQERQRKEARIKNVTAAIDAVKAQFFVEFQPEQYQTEIDKLQKELESKPFWAIDKKGAIKKRIEDLKIMQKGEEISGKIFTSSLKEDAKVALDEVKRLDQSIIDIQKRMNEVGKLSVSAEISGDTEAMTNYNKEYERLNSELQKELATRGKLIEPYQKMMGLLQNAKQALIDELKALESSGEYNPSEVEALNSQISRVDKAINSLKENGVTNLSLLQDQFEATAIRIEKNNQRLGEMLKEINRLKAIDLANIAESFASGEITQAQKDIRTARVEILSLQKELNVTSAMYQANLKEIDTLMQRPTQMLSDEEKGRRTELINSVKDQEMQILDLRTRLADATVQARQASESAMSDFISKAGDRNKQAIVSEAESLKILQQEIDKTLRFAKLLQEESGIKINLDFSGIKAYKNYLEAVAGMASELGVDLGGYVSEIGGFVSDQAEIQRLLNSKKPEEKALGKQLQAEQKGRQTILLGDLKSEIETAAINREAQNQINQLQSQNGDVFQAELSVGEIYIARNNALINNRRQQIIHLAKLEQSGFISKSIQLQKTKQLNDEIQAAEEDNLNRQSALLDSRLALIQRQEDADIRSAESRAVSSVLGGADPIATEKKRQSELQQIIRSGSKNRIQALNEETESLKLSLKNGTITYEEFISKEKELTIKREEEQRQSFDRLNQVRQDNFSDLNATRDREIARLESDLVVMKAIGQNTIANEVITRSKINSIIQESLNDRRKYIDGERQLNRENLANKTITYDQFLVVEKELNQASIELEQDSVERLKELSQERIDLLQKVREAQSAVLDAQIKGQERAAQATNTYADALSKQGDLLQAQAKIRGLGSNKAILKAELETAKLNKKAEAELADLSKKMESAPESEQAKIKEEIARKEAEVKARVEDYSLRIAQEKAKLLAEEQATQRKLLALEIERNKIAAQQQIREAEINALRARNAVAEAKIQATEAQVSGDPVAFIQAQLGLQLATEEFQFALAQIDINKQNAVINNRLAELQRQGLVGDQSLERMRQAGEFEGQFGERPNPFNFGGNNFGFTLDKDVQALADLGNRLTGITDFEKYDQLLAQLDQAAKPLEAQVSTQERVVTATEGLTKGINELNTKISSLVWELGRPNVTVTENTSMDNVIGLMRMTR